MADLTGGSSSSPSLGYGIGLSGQFDSSGINQISKGIQMAGAAKQRQATEKKKLDTDWEKYAANLKITGDIDPMYQNQVKELVGGHISKLAKAHQEQPYEHPYNIQSLMEDKANVDVGMKVIGNNTAAIKEFDRLRPQLFASGKFEVNKENEKIFNEARTKNDPSLLEKIKDSEGNSIVSGGAINPTTLAQAIFKEKPRDVQKEFLASNVKPVIVEKAYQVPSGEYISTSDNKLVDVQASKQNLKALLSDPNWQVGQGYLERTKGDIDKAADLMFNAYGYKAQESSKQGLKQKSTAGSTKEELHSAASTTQEYNAGTTPSGEKKTIVAEGNLTFKRPMTATVSIPKGTINGKDFTSIEQTGVDKNVSMGGMQNLPVYKGTNEVITKEALDILKKKGMADKVEYKTFVPASSTEKVINPLTGTETPSTESYFLPLDAVKTTIEKNGEKDAVVKFEQEAKQKTSSLSSSEKKSDSSIKEISSEAEYNKLPKGSKYIYGGVTLIKK